MSESTSSTAVELICPGVREIRNSVSEKVDILIRQWQEVEDALKILSCDLEAANREQTGQLQSKLQTVMKHFLDMEGRLQNQCRAITSAASKKPVGCLYRPGEDGRRVAMPEVLPRVLRWTDFLRTLKLEADTAQRYGSELSIAFLKLQYTDPGVGKEDGGSEGIGKTELITTLLPTIRRCDIIGRLCAGQFVLLFPHTTSEQAVIAIHRFEQLLQCTTKNGDKKIDKLLKINCSFSLTEYRPEETPVNTLKRLVSKNS